MSLSSCRIEAMLGHLFSAAGLAALAACSGGGVAAPPGGGVPCTLHLTETAGNLALSGVIDDPAVTGWTLSARARDGSVNIRQSGPATADGPVAIAHLPGVAADYTLAMTVTRGADTLACAQAVE